VIIMTAHPATDRHDPLDTIAPLRQFVIAMTRLVERTQDEKALLQEGRTLLSELIRDDRWLPQAFAQGEPGTYRQYLLHCDPLERFSVVSFVWGQGARTPVHDHTVWGLVGMLRGAELCHEYTARSATEIVDTGREHVMKPGVVDAVSPAIGDWHTVANALPDQTSISIHVYGGNIGAVRRHRLDDTGTPVDFISGYSGGTLPNLWDRSASVLAASAR
jgi:predicted metal-dependent enzyme (double-stranded beta helix superfamily)